MNDTNALLPMFQDAETMRLTGHHAEGEPDEARLRAWYGTRADHDGRLDLVEKATGDVVGEAVPNEWDAGNEGCNCRIAFGPGAHGRGLGTEATRLIVRYRFERLGPPRISLEVYAFNPRARRVYEKVGFVPEGVLRDALLWEGERVDAALMSILHRAGSSTGGGPSGLAGRRLQRLTR